MKKLLTAVIMGISVSSAWADNFNSIILQGYSTYTITGVDVNVLSGGSPVGTGTQITIDPDDTTHLYSTMTYINDPRVLRDGSDYELELKKSGAVIDTFPMTAMPFALAVRGDAEAGDQNIFSAYGNVGIGTSTPSYRLVVSSAGVDLMWVGSDGISADRYKIKGVTVLSVDPYAGQGNTNVGAYANAYTESPGWYNSFFGKLTGMYTAGDGNSFFGHHAGALNTSGVSNVFIGAEAGYSNETGGSNIYIGPASGANTESSDNIFIGAGAGQYITTGSSNIIIGQDHYGLGATASGALNIGGLIFGNLIDKTIGISQNIPQAALDVVSTGTAANQFAQIWRNSAGTIISSVSATGVMMASRYVGDGSGLTGLPSGADNLGNHTATQALDMVNNQILNVSSLTVAGAATILSTLTVQAIMPDNFVGGIMYFAKSTCPNGFLEANGDPVSRTTYGKLFTAIGTTFGPGDGETTFDVPDLRGEFVRGVDDGRGVDSSRVFGSTQTDTFQGHYHGVSDPGHRHYTTGNNGGGYIRAAAEGLSGTTYPTMLATTGVSVASPTTDGVDGTPRISSETRPRNIALMSCIKY